MGDPVSDLILDEAGDPGGVVLVVDDVGGALASAALDRGARVLAACDDVRDEEELPDGVERVSLMAPVAPDLHEVRTVLWRLPRAVAAVEDVAQVLASRCSSEVHVYGGGRDKHLAPAMNDALGACFGEVSASLGRRKSRVLRASVPRPVPRTWPRHAHLDELGLEVVAYGGVFAGTALDRGTRLLLRAVDHAAPVPGRALDLGCGTGIIAAALAARGWDVVASDASASAVASTILTGEANGHLVDVRRADGLPAGLDGLDLIACNPPFHRGGAKDSSAAFAMIEDAGRALRPGGELWLVFNAHLPYLPVAREHVGPTRVVARDSSYVVTRSIAR